ncbi:MAG TPA: hypothetical protein VGP72_20685 [Planctomycetota bacterium]|jgi:AraC-like DNA-binding protein
MIASTIGGGFQSPVISEQSPVGVCDAVAEETEKRLAAYKREQEKFGKHPMWRRLTGLTFDYESRVTPKARKKGLKRLVAWLKEKSSCAESARAGGLTGAENAAAVGSSSRQGTETETRREDEQRKRDARITLTNSWDIEPAEWVRAEVCGTQLEELCRRLEISSARLSALTKECCGMTAQEVIDGFKMENVRRALGERLREAARELWGRPGDCALEKIGPHGRIQKSEFRMQNCGCDYAGGPKPSRFFRGTGSQRRREDEIEERERRVKELLARMRAQCDTKRFAMMLGFASSSRLSGACLNVLGRSLRRVEQMLAEEVVRYYICAEDRRLREIALGPDTALGYAARELYCGTEEKPEAPFLDNWSLQETFARDWLMQMAEAFG